MTQPSPSQRQANPPFASLEARSHVEQKWLDLGNYISIMGQLCAIAARHDNPGTAILTDCKDELLNCRARIRSDLEHFDDLSRGTSDARE